MQYAKQVSDVTLKQRGNYDDSIRLNRRQKRKQKAGKIEFHMKIVELYREEKAGEERETAYSGAAPERLNSGETACYE